MIGDKGTFNFNYLDNIGGDIGLTKDEVQKLIDMLVIERKLIKWDKKFPGEE